MLTFASWVSGLVASISLLGMGQSSSSLSHVSHCWHSHNAQYASWWLPQPWKLFHYQNPSICCLYFMQVMFLPWFDHINLCHHVPYLHYGFCDWYIYGVIHVFLDKVCSIVHLMYTSHFCGSRRLAALKHGNISNVWTKQYVLVHTADLLHPSMRCQELFLEVILMVGTQYGWGRNLVTLNWLASDFCEQSPSSEPESFSQKFPFCETKWFFTMCTGPCLVLSYLNPVHSLTPYFFQICFNIFLSTYGSLNCSHHLRFQFFWLNL
jgi:hypothetical protein